MSEEIAMADSTNVFEQIFLTILQKEGMKTLQNPAVFVSLVKEYTRGEVEHQQVLEQILREKLVKHFSQEDLSTAASVDHAVDRAERMVMDQYSLSREWAKAVCEGMGNALKKVQGFPMESKAEKTSWHTEQSSEIPPLSDPPTSVNRNWLVEPCGALGIGSGFCSRFFLSASNQ